MRAYSVLWAKLEYAPFNREQAIEIMPNRRVMMGVILSRLRKAGGLDVQFNETDTRKRQYELKRLENIIVEIAGGNTNA
jgi:hypothetical protein